VLDIAVIVILLVAAFAAVAWYANKSSKQRTKILEEINNIEPEIADSEQFSSVFQQELEQQTRDNEHFEIDSEPKITFSEQIQSEIKAQPTATAQPDVEAETPAQEKPSQNINITVDDDFDDTILSSDDVTTEHIIAPEQATDDVAASQIQTELINDWDMMIAFTVMAREGSPFSGKSVKATLESLDLHFGDLQIFHRSMPGLRKQTLFSVANILDPGTLLPDSFATMHTPGLLVFARLPGPVNGLSLFDDLLDVAEKMTDKLDGSLCDESRQPLTQSAIEAMRSRILTLNLQLQTEQSNYRND